MLDSQCRTLIVLWQLTTHTIVAKLLPCSTVIQPNWHLLPVYYAASNKQTFALSLYLSFLRSLGTILPKKSKCIRLRLTNSTGAAAAAAYVTFHLEA